MDTKPVTEPANSFRIGPNRAPPPPRPSSNLLSKSTKDDYSSSSGDYKTSDSESITKTTLKTIKVVICGGGFAGASLAVALQKDPELDVILIDPKEFFVYTPSLMYLLSQPNRKESIIVPYENVMKKGKFIQASISDMTRKKVYFNDTSIEFDYCYICTGISFVLPGSKKNQNSETEINSTKLQSPHSPSSSKDTSILATSSTESRMVPTTTSPKRRRPSSPTIEKKSPAKKKSRSTSSKSISLAITHLQRLKAILKDPILTKMFHSFLATFAENIQELRMLSFLNDVAVFKSLFSSSNSSTSQTLKNIKKQYNFIIQQYIQPNAPSELRFTNDSHLGSKESIKDILLSQDQKSLDASVFKSAKRIVLNILSQNALDRFLCAASTDLVSNTRESNNSPVSGDAGHSLSSSSGSSSSSKRANDRHNIIQRSESPPVRMEIHSANSTPSQSPIILTGSNSLMLEIYQVGSALPPLPPSKSSSSHSVGSNAPSITQIHPSQQAQNMSFNYACPKVIPTLRKIVPISVSCFWDPNNVSHFMAANRIAIIGGDLVAVELAAEIHTRFPQKSLIIIHSHRHLLAPMSENVRNIIESFFKNRNIEIWRKKHVVAIQPFKLNDREISHLLFADGTTLEADKVFFCNADFHHGNTSFLKNHFGEFLDGRGFAKVDKHLRLGNTQNIFVLGDAAGFNEYKVAERARAHASLAVTNLKRLRQGLEMEAYRERPVPKTYDLILGPANGIQIENGRFVRIGPGPAERRAFAERRILHRLGALSLALNVDWSQLIGTIDDKNSGLNSKLDETAGSRGDTSSDATHSLPNTRKSNRKQLSVNKKKSKDAFQKSVVADEEDSSEIRKSD